MKTEVSKELIKIKKLNTCKVHLKCINTRIDLIINTNKSVLF